MEQNAAGRNKAHRALAVVSRLQLLDILRGSNRPLDVRELASACGLHLSTVRFHLDVLTRAGLVVSQTSARPARGRPRLLYAPASIGGTGNAPRTSYELLAEALAAGWAADPAEGAQRAEMVGWSMAAEQGLASEPPEALTSQQAAARVSAFFAELGFDPELASDGDGLQIRLHACPFWAVATAHPDVVCSMHLGLLRGALAELGAPPAAVRLLPFVEPHLCVTHITPHPEPVSGTAIRKMPGAEDQP